MSEDELTRLSRVKYVRLTRSQSKSPAPQNRHVWYHIAFFWSTTSNVPTDTGTFAGGLSRPALLSSTLLGSN